MLTTRKVILIGLALLMLAAGALLYLDSQQKYTGGYKNGKYNGAGVIEYRNGAGSKVTSRRAKQTALAAISCQMAMCLKVCGKSRNI